MQIIKQICEQVWVLEPLIKFIPRSPRNNDFKLRRNSKMLRITDLSERHFELEFYECVAQTFAQQFKFI